MPETQQSSNISAMFNNDVSEKKISKILYNMSDETKRLIKYEFAKSHKNSESIQVIKNLLKKPTLERN